MSIEEFALASKDIPGLTHMYELAARRDPILLRIFAADSFDDPRFEEVLERIIKKYKE